MEIQLHSTEQTKKLARKLALKLKVNDVVALYGDLGSGKTTFTRYLCNSLGIDTKVQSPTFVIHRKYSGGNGPIKKVNHIDLYRMKTKEDVMELGLDEIIGELEAITIIEWPEIVEKELPDNTVKIKFEYLESGEESRTAYVQNID